MNTEIRDLFKYYGGQLGDLDQSGNTIAEYVWIDGSGITLRSKAKTINKKITCLDDLPEWNYDGSSCYQAQTENSEVLLKPVFFCRDPFRRGDNIIVMCESYVWADNKYQEKKPEKTNFRHHAAKIFEAVQSEEPWFGIEQEYSLLEIHNNFTIKPLGWPSSGFPGP